MVRNPSIAFLISPVDLTVCGSALAPEAPLSVRPAAVAADRERSTPCTYTS
jgi:hypothetical protein